uniref:Uncharacterized protein LOC111101302 n=1 Tax=Crassostrea virginica TaxID=6565 RepID=A0A8B8EZ36_CRAVI|nr:uncharacterized protein LOC111101302 [Crassostrea virginica]XP_022345264.1 uncharacterized protein LOC111137860 [Crassostrea virginica]
MYEDSQNSAVPEENRPESQDMFESQENNAALVHACTGCIENNELLRTILQELRDLKKSLNVEKEPRMVIENSPIEAPIMEYLKKNFPKKIFLGDPDLELKAKVISLIQSLGIKCDVPVMLRSINKYSSRKYVDFRRQTKSKLLSTQKDAGVLCIQDLGRYLFKKFTPDLNTKVEQTTIVLRAFCHEKKLLKKHHAAEPTSVDFWADFKAYRVALEEDEDPLKWDKLRAREERRIDRYVKL